MGDILGVSSNDFLSVMPLCAVVSLVSNGFKDIPTI